MKSMQLLKNWFLGILITFSICLWWTLPRKQETRASGMANAMLSNTQRLTDNELSDIATSLVGATSGNLGLMFETVFFSMLQSQLLLFCAHSQFNNSRAYYSICLLCVPLPVSDSLLSAPEKQYLFTLETHHVVVAVFTLQGRKFYSELLYPRT
jgi:predicted permease